MKKRIFPTGPKMTKIVRDYYQFGRSPSSIARKYRLQLPQVFATIERYETHDAR